MCGASESTGQENPSEKMEIQMENGYYAALHRYQKLEAAAKPITGPGWLSVAFTNGVRPVLKQVYRLWSPELLLPQEDPSLYPTRHGVPRPARRRHHDAV